MSQTRMILFTAVFFVLFDNFAFFSHVLKVFPVSPNNTAFLISLVFGLVSVIVLLLSLVCYKGITKPVLILLLLVSSLAGYFMDNYNVVIDDIMIQNMVQTNIHEAYDLLTLKLVYYFFLLGVLPALVISRVKIRYVSWKKALMTRLLRIFISALAVVAIVLVFSRFYTSFFREHKPLRYYTNPTYYIYSVGKYIHNTFNPSEVELQVMGTDAHIPETDPGRRLVILVVGEAVRADRLSLNGYERETTPLLEREDVVSFSQVYSCGTSTSYSVPCMFSVFPREQYSSSKADAYENLLDVVKHAGVHVLWRDNNSDSKGVAIRVAYQGYQSPDTNPVCDVECRDVGMLAGLQEYIDARPEGNIIIVLHQMGNHGPAYYKRYPPEYERFTPVCRTNRFDKCTKEEINNAYDNAVLYTDYFLSRVITLLKQNAGRFEAAMVYMSDHGESLGEHGVYLHGLPYAIAPDAQTHIGVVLWLSNGFKADKNALRGKAAHPFSHDNLFHTILGLLDVKTSLYDENMDILLGG